MTRKATDVELAEAKADYSPEELTAHQQGREAFDANKSDARKHSRRVHEEVAGIGSKLDAAFRRGWFERREEGS
jgi:hypothetical protein